MKKEKLAQTYPINYRVSSFIQELRSRTIESSKLAPECPFILLSDETNINNYYRKDPTSHDLFDRVISKSEASTCPREIGAQLISLVKGYRQIIDARGTNGKINSIEKLLTVGENAVDQRISHNFDTKHWKVVANEYATFILKQIIRKPGLLIDESFLAARLGIDISKSADWSKLLSKLESDVKFKGIFSEGWQRWWAENLVSWWDNLKGAPKNLRNTSATDRVLFLKKKFKLKELVAASPIQRGYSSFFWTVCKARKLPLDPINGFMINAEEPKPWQEVEYISTIAALKKEKYDTVNIHPMELPKYRLLANSFAKKNG